MIVCLFESSLSLVHFLSTLCHAIQLGVYSARFYNLQAFK